MGFNTINWVDLARDKDLLESRCKFGIELPISIIHEVEFIRFYGNVPASWSRGLLHVALYSFYGIEM